MTTKTFLITMDISSKNLKDAFIFIIIDYFDDVKKREASDFIDANFNIDEIFNSARFNKFVQQQMTAGYNNVEICREFMFDGSNTYNAKIITKFQKHYNKNKKNMPKTKRTIVFEGSEKEINSMIALIKAHYDVAMTNIEQ